MKYYVICPHKKDVEELSFCKARKHTIEVYNAKNRDLAEIFFPQCIDCPLDELHIFDENEVIHSRYCQRCGIDITSLSKYKVICDACHEKYYGGK